MTPHFVLSSSYGNDSMAMLQWAHEVALDLFGTVTVTYCDTGWAKPQWAGRVELCEEFARSLGFNVERIVSMGMHELVRMKKGWPGNGQQFCTIHLKGVPFLNWIDDTGNDPDCDVVMVGKRRAESEARKDTPEFIIESEYHGGRILWHPLFLHSDEDRDALLDRAGAIAPPEGWDGNHDRLYILPHRSEECNPCVNANRGDIKRLSADEMAKVNELEVEIGKPMFRPKRFNGLGIYGVVMWARHGKHHAEDIPEDSGCGAPFGCGL